MGLENYVTGTLWDWDAMGLVHNRTETELVWYMVYNSTGTTLVWYTIGLRHHRHCTWYTRGLGHNRTWTTRAWYTMGLVDNRTGELLGGSAKLVCESECPS